MSRCSGRLMNVSSAWGLLDLLQTIFLFGHPPGGSDLVIVGMQSYSNIAQAFDTMSRDDGTVRITHRFPFRNISSG